MSEERARPENPRGTPAGFTRRGFLKGVALSAGAAAVPAEGLIGGAQAAPAEGRKVGPGPVAITLRVNGKDIHLEVEPRVTLLDALRDHLDVQARTPVDLTGSKRVCDRASCGACTMIIDGRTVYGCSTLAIEVQGKEIITVEGISGDEKPHPLQEAFVECDGLMCGFCTPGFVVSSRVLLDRNPYPTPEEIRRALSGNICRCGTYNRVFEAVELASIRMRKEG